MPASTPTRGRKSRPTVCTSMPIEARAQSTNGSRVATSFTPKTEYDAAIGAYDEHCLVPANAVGAAEDDDRGTGGLGADGAAVGALRGRGTGGRGSGRLAVRGRPTVGRALQDVG